MTAFDHIRTIVAQHRHRQSLPNPYRDELGALLWPRITHAPSGREILFDSEMVAALEDLADCLRTDAPNLERSVGYDEWLALVREKVAYALDASDPDADLDVTACHVLEDVSSSLVLSTARLGLFEFPFGCTLFAGVVLRPICLGPVRFETRQDWLERKFAEGAVSDLTRRRVLRAWEGQTLRKRMRSKDTGQEKAILGLSRDAPFVCSVGTNGMAHEFGRQRARTAARLALAAIALMWRRTSRVLNGMNLVDDRVVHNLHEITFHDSRLASWGVRNLHMPGGHGLNAEKWASLQRDFADHFAVVGDLLKSIVDVITPPKRPNMTHALTHALLWFHQGCREDQPVIAITNFAATLDCLACGSYQEGIRDLIKARLGHDSKASLWLRGGQTVDKAVEEIYDHARTATMHGRKDRKGKLDSKPFHDWSPGRDRAEALTRICLLACIDWTAQHPDCDNPASWRTT